MRRTGWAVLWAGVLGSVAAAQQQQAAEKTIEQRLEALQKEVADLKKQAVGRGSSVAPANVSGDYTRLARSGIALPGQGVTSRENETVKIGGALDFEFFDSESDGRNRGKFIDPGSGAARQFGMNNGATEFRIHRLELFLDLEMIKDFVFHSTLLLDPVVREQDEGSVDIDEAYVRFGHLARNLFGVEDPSNTFVMAGTYYRWERDYLNRFTESYSLPGTSFYRDEVTGVQIGGDFEWGLFYRVSIDNGTLLTARDAGVGRGPGAIGNAPIFHDDEQLGDVNNSKDFSLGIGFNNQVDDPKVEYGAALSYRIGKLSGAERAFLKGISPAYDGTGTQQRIGLMFKGEWDLDTVRVGGNAEAWFASDGNADRQAVTLAPYAKVPLDGVFYQNRLFFTSVGAGYRWSYLHLEDGFGNATKGVAQTSILDDLHMHTFASWVDVTQNVDLRLEFNVMDFNNSRSGTQTEWLLQWSLRF